MSQNYNKLVRDKIPDIIMSNGEFPVTKILNDEEYTLMLNQKLEEEVKEYLESGSPEELADILEVIRSIGITKCLTLDDILKIMEDKKAKRGGFDERILLVEVTNKKSR
ncbi:MAG: nucleoside triphosphate pyrophosphohydrolase [Bacilli bacterium]|nr:nucleoside triphosphate pyrophosphohydrolase [Bacilli bacterium]MDD4298159.1 nucleoside triphosphate pyrophosphohydrolase [Bacilli bacterium]MDD4643806.1 nucleoside triphosphate pyrophosphohydrolase [Bacilli bacterium]